jgi:hypothetical protein
LSFPLGEYFRKEQHRLSSPLLHSWYSTLQDTSSTVFIKGFEFLVLYQFPLFLKRIFDNSFSVNSVTGTNWTGSFTLSLFCLLIQTFCSPLLQQVHCGLKSGKSKKESSSSCLSITLVELHWFLLGVVTTKSFIGETISKSRLNFYKLQT